MRAHLLHVPVLAPEAGHRARVLGRAPLEYDGLIRDERAAGVHHGAADHVDLAAGPKRVEQARVGFVRQFDLEILNKIYTNKRRVLVKTITNVIAVFTNFAVSYLEVQGLLKGIFHFQELAHTPGEVEGI